MGHYPADFDVTYPMRRLDRLTTLLRPVLIVPIVLVAGAVAGRQGDADQVEPSG